jgi:hypothetical protein
MRKKYITVLTAASQCLIKIHLSLIKIRTAFLIPSTPNSPKLCLSSLPTKVLHSLLFRYSCYITNPSHPSTFNHLNVLGTQRKKQNTTSSIFIHHLLLLPGIYNPHEFQPPPSGGSEITHKDAPQSVGLLWTSDQPVAETSV